jgi:hypothetical protein
MAIGKDFQVNQDYAFYFYTQKGIRMAKYNDFQNALQLAKKKDDDYWKPMHDVFNSIGTHFLNYLGASGLVIKDFHGNSRAAVQVGNFTTDCSQANRHIPIGFDNGVMKFDIRVSVSMLDSNVEFGFVVLHVELARRGDEYLFSLNGEGPITCMMFAASIGGEPDSVDCTQFFERCYLQILDELRNYSFH